MSNIPQQGGPTEDDGDELLFEGVNLPAKWSRTQVRDWSLLHPRVPHTSMRLYLVVRSMIIENDKRGGAGLRPLTYDQLCWLLPGVNGKPTSLTTVKDALRVLDAEGLMTNPDDRRIVTSTGRGKVQVLRRFQVHDFPRDDYRGWRNAWDKLAAYRPDWRENPPEPPPLPPVPVGYRRPGVVPSLETAGQGPAAGPAAPDAGNPAPNDGTSPNETPDEVPSLETAGQGPAAGPAAPDAGNPAPNDGTSPNETPDEVPSDKTAGQIIGRISGVDDGIPSSTTEKRRRQAADLPPGGPKKLVGKKPVEEKKKTPQGAARSASYVGSARDAQAPAARPAALAAGGGTRLDRSRVRAEVLALLPESVRKRLPQRTPLPLADVIAEQAQHRTVAELGDRVRRRWDRRGYATQTIESPVGVAVALLRSPACPDDRCEDGRVIGTGDMIHTGDPCVSCQQHKANRAAAKRAGETPPVRTLTRSVSAPPPAECVSCQKPWKAGSTVPEDGVCADCRRESAAADAEIAALMQATVDKWEREAAERQAAEDAERAEAERRRLEAEAAEEAAAAEARRVAAEDAERRARIAEKFPELVTPKQSTTAPF